MYARHERGRGAEEHAHRYLCARGLEPVARNYRCKVGELDLVMLDGTTLVVAEVRYRRDRSFMNPLESIDARKRGRLVRATEHFLQRHPEFSDTPVRFDVLTVEGQPGQEETQWIRSAFDTGD